MSLLYAFRTMKDKIQEKIISCGILYMHTKKGGFLNKKDELLQKWNKVHFEKLINTFKLNQVPCSNIENTT